jgi:hypothetical protein
VEAGHSDALARRRAAIYREMLELEFDFKTGKLSESDHRELSQSLLARAAVLLEQEQRSDDDLERSLGREIAAARAGHTPMRQPTATSGSNPR